MERKKKEKKEKELRKQIAELEEKINIKLEDIQKLRKNSNCFPLFMGNTSMMNS